MGLFGINVIVSNFDKDAEIFNVGTRIDGKV